LARSIRLPMSIGAGSRQDATGLVTRRGFVRLTFALAGTGYLLLSLIAVRRLSLIKEASVSVEAVAVMIAGLAILSFVALVLPGVLLALQGWRRLSILPAAAYFVGVVVFILFLGGGIPSEWVVLRLATLILVLLPPLVLGANLRQRPSRNLNKMDGSGLAVSFAIAAGVLFAWGVIIDSIPSMVRELSYPFETFAACFAFGALTGTSRPGWPWAPFLVPALLVGWVLGSFLLVSRVSGAPWPPAADFLLLPLAPAVLVTLAGTMWQPLSEKFNHNPGKHALFLLVAVNALNGADAILTELALRSGQATEFNPVASGLGSIGKVALVGLASYLLYRIRPNALFWPMVLLALVIAYHAAGALLDL
jgi:hypothetical protein